MFEPMRYTALFGILGVLFAGAAVQSAAGGDTAAAWVVAAAEGYVALCLMTMALIYAWNDRGLPLEWAFGRTRRRPVVGLLLLPYRWLARVTIAMLRRFDAMALLHPVGPRLFVGRLPLASDHARLAEHGITSVLNLCAEFPRPSAGPAASAIETEYLPVLDGTAPSDRQFRQAVDWIAARHGAGRSVLVHCAQGRGRSVTVAAAALCRLGLAADPDDALARIRAVRPMAKPSRRQRSALARYWDSVRPDAIDSH